MHTQPTIHSLAVDVMLHEMSTIGTIGTLFVSNSMGKV